MISFVNGFLRCGKFPTSINTTWVTLISKCEAACDIDDFRPLTMVGCLYKVIYKVLTRRLRTVLWDVISESQTCFVHGRNINDGLIIANETIYWLKRHKVLGALFKIDFKKAYDYVK